MVAEREKLQPELPGSKCHYIWISNNHSGHFWHIIDNIKAGDFREWLHLDLYQKGHLTIWGRFEYHYFVSSHYSYPDFCQGVFITIETSVGMKRGKMNVPTPLSFHEPPEARISHLLLVELTACPNPNATFVGPYCSCCLTQTFCQSM